jgi:hypothetical protein
VGFHLLPKVLEAGRSVERGWAWPCRRRPPLPGRRNGVESASLGVPIQLLMSCQLFITQTLPAFAARASEGLAQGQRYEARDLLAQSL